VSLILFELQQADNFHVEFVRVTHQPQMFSFALCVMRYFHQGKGLSNYVSPIAAGALCNFIESFVQLLRELEIQPHFIGHLGDAPFSSFSPALAGGDFP
jgi:hypothetical protein